MFKKVFFELNKNIAVITLNNPKKLNAWDFEMRSQIISLIKDIKKNNVNLSEEFLNIKDLESNSLK